MCLIFDEKVAKRHNHEEKPCKIVNYSIYTNIAVVNFV